MKLYYGHTCHQNILRDHYFLPSIKDDFQMYGSQFSYEGERPDFGTRAFHEITLKKTEYLLKIMQENLGGLFVYSDVDVQFFKPVQTILQNAITDCDMALQRDSARGLMGTGFFVCRSSKRLLAFWQHVYRSLKTGRTLWHEQNAFNRLINPCVKRSFLKDGMATMLRYGWNRIRYRDLRFRFLPDTFFTCGTQLAGKSWQPGMEIDVPEDIVMHHANWTRGLQNKIALLEYVRDRVAGSRPLSQTGVQ